MFIAKDQQQMQFWGNIFQQVLNHPQSLGMFDPLHNSSAATMMAEFTDQITTQLINRISAFESAVRDPKIVTASPGDVARAAANGGLRLTTTD